MEPTIYKPGAYNTPGIYKGAGGIYNGRGVYNIEQSSNDDIIYKTNFSFFDISTGVDIPLVGNNAQWTVQNPIEKTTIEIEGKIYSAIHPKADGYIRLYNYLDDYDFYSVSFKVVKTQNVTGGIGGAQPERELSSVPHNNDYDSNRGWDIIQKNKISIEEIYNNYHSSNWDSAAYISNYYQSTQINKIMTGGATIDKTNNIIGVFFEGKKVFKASINSSFASCVQIYSDYSDSKIYAIELEITKQNLFKNME